MLQTIHILPDSEVHQIAAGEVIESPASVVKELIDNAIDASSTSIRIDIKQGGLTSIRVSDNGIGMYAKDLALSLIPHATSKIRSIDDLTHVQSLGFRGEALASIGAISHLKITTAPRASSLPLGWHITMEAGQPSPIVEVARTAGTTVEVTRLFENVPVRKEFQKSAQRCLTEITKMVARIALAYPHLAIALYAEQREVFSTHPNETAPMQEQLQHAICALLGTSFFNDLLPFSWEEEEISLEGFLGKPAVARPTRSGQFLMINGRPVNHLPVSRAICEGFGPRLAPHTHPLFVFHLRLPSAWLDVNVHPQKKEIRLRFEAKVAQTLRAAVVRALEQTSFSPPLPPLPLLEQAPQFLCRETPPLPPCSPPEAEPLSFFHPVDDIPAIGLFRSFLLVDGSWSAFPSPSEALIFVDLRGAEKRLAYDQALNRLEKKAALQGLLTPLSLEFTPQEALQVNHHLQQLEAWGIGLRSFGPHSYLVDALAPEIDSSDIKTLILKLTEEIEACDDDAKPCAFKRKEKLALTFCRHGSLYNRTWTLEQAKELVRTLLTLKDPHYTPSGKPIIKHMAV